MCKALTFTGDETVLNGERQSKAMNLIRYCRLLYSVATVCPCSVTVATISSDQNGDHLKLFLQ